MPTPELTAYEVGAVIGFHEKEANAWRKQAIRARSLATLRGPDWQKQLTRAIRCERYARRHDERAKQFR